MALDKKAVASTPPAPITSPAAPTPPTEAQKTKTAQTSPPQNSQAHKISSCNGVSGDANFREFPSLDPAAILGVVAEGDTVYLTGRRVSVNGEIWYGATVPSAIAHSGKRIQPNQQGWIAGCFVEGFRERTLSGKESVAVPTMIGAPILAMRSRSLSSNALYTSS